MPKTCRTDNAIDWQMPVTHERFLHLTAQISGGYSKLDTALAHTLRMAGDMVETAEQMGLSPQVGQALFTDLARCTDAIIQSRSQFLKAHRRAHKIRRSTTVAWEGCPIFSELDQADAESSPVGLHVVPKAA